MKRITTAYPRLTESEVDAMLVDARRSGPANCWTGTQGTLAAHVVRLIADREQHGAGLGRLASDAGLSSASQQTERPALDGPGRVAGLPFKNPADGSAREDGATRGTREGQPASHG